MQAYVWLTAWQSKELRLKYYAIVLLGMMVKRITCEWIVNITGNLCEPSSIAYL